MTGLKLEKAKIREEMLAKRMAIPEEIRAKADISMAARLTSLTSFRFAQVILLYSPIKCEPNTKAIAEAAIKAGKRIAYPVCDPETSVMTYRFVSSPSELILGTYNISEPASDAEDYVPAPYKHDICIVPAVCFDRAGFRIGYGKGYYDRFLSSFGGTTIGLAMSEMVVNKLPRGRFDRSVDLIITEKGVISLS